MVCVFALMGYLISFPLLSDKARLLLHYGLIVLFCVPLLPAIRRCGILRQGGFKLFVFYFAWALFTVSYSLAPMFSVARLGASILAFGVCALCAAQIREREDVDRLIERFVIALGLIVALNVVALAALPSSLTYGTEHEAEADEPVAGSVKQVDDEDLIPRFRGILDHPNAIGGLSLMAVAAALLYWPRSGRRRKVLLALMALSALALGVVADSRSPVAAITIGCSLFVLWRHGVRGVALLMVAGFLVFSMMGLAGYRATEYIQRGDVTTLTGRTEMWAFVVDKIKERPVLGFGYEVAGAIFKDPRFPVWWGPYEEGAHSSVHNGYLGHMIGVGVPATLFWLFIFLRPWGALLMRKDDPWMLKPAIFLVVIPLLIHNLAEMSLGDFSDSAGFMFGMMWAVAERWRLLTRESQSAEQTDPAARPLADETTPPFAASLGNFSP
jgi:hypothetical protein